MPTNLRSRRGCRGRRGRPAAWCAVGALSLLLGGMDSACASTKHSLDEPPDDQRVCRIDCTVNVSGQVETAAGKEKREAHNLEVAGTFGYLERRLAGTGRDALALRALRNYEQAAATISVAGQETASSLRPARRRIVAQGLRSGVFFFCLDGTMNAEELELLRVPGDSLTAAALLPRQSVEVGETWRTASWVPQMIAGVDALLKGELTCRFESIDAAVARVSLNGALEGATDGAATKITLTGHYLYDVKQRMVTRLELEQTEKRAIGAVSPGLNVVAKVVYSRRLSEDPGRLADALVEAVPLDPDPRLLRLSFRTPWGVQLHFDRDWRVFQQSNDVVILRLISRGSFIAQCNLTRIQSAAPGGHTQQAEFQQDIREALGSRLKEITEDEILETGGDAFKYRVTAVGESDKVSMQWIYYLCADRSGVQTALVFSVETKFREQLGDRDRQIVDSLEFLEKAIVPAKAP